KLQTVDTGFRQEGVISARVIFQQLNLPTDRYPAFKDELLDRIRAIPGVEAAAVVHEIPLDDWGGANVWMDSADARQGKHTNLSRIGPTTLRRCKSRCWPGGISMLATESAHRGWRV